MWHDFNYLDRTTQDLDAGLSSHLGDTNQQEQEGIVSRDFQLLDGKAFHPVIYLFIYLIVYYIIFLRRHNSNPATAAINLLSFGLFSMA